MPQSYGRFFRTTLAKFCPELPPSWVTSVAYLAVALAWTISPLSALGETKTETSPDRICTTQTAEPRVSHRLQRRYPFEHPSSCTWSVLRLSLRRCARTSARRWARTSSAWSPGRCASAATAQAPISRRTLRRKATARAKRAAPATTPSVAVEVSDRLRIDARATYIGLTLRCGWPSFLRSLGSL